MSSYTHLFFFYSLFRRRLRIVLDTFSPSLLYFSLRAPGLASLSVSSFPLFCVSYFSLYPNSLPSACGGSFHVCVFFFVLVLQLRTTSSVFFFLEFLFALVGRHSTKRESSRSMKAHSFFFFPPRCFFFFFFESFFELPPQLFVLLSTLYQQNKKQKLSFLF